MVQHEIKICEIRNLIIFGVSHRLCIVLRAFVYFPGYRKIHTVGTCAGAHGQCHMQLYDKLPFGFPGKTDGKVGIVLFCTCALYPLYEQCRTDCICSNTRHSALYCKNIYGADAFSYKLYYPEKNYFPTQVLISIKVGIIFFPYKIQQEKEEPTMTEMRYALIPAYQPDQRLIEITEQLTEKGFQVVVVDDGSGEEYADVFQELLPFADVVTHPTNCGKGAALKTGLAAIEEKGGAEYVVVTLDADGQHSIDDVIKVTEAAEKNKDALILGTRGFDTNVPVKSRLGNDITRCVFSFVTGVKVQDTQTGLRAFSNQDVAFMQQIEGDRYEYEINVLLEYAKRNRTICEVPITTIYLDDNKSSHFHAVRDSFLIYMEILKHIDIRAERRGAGW